MEKEKRSELKIVAVALAIIAAQVLGVDIQALSTLAGNESAAIIDTIKAANNGDGGMWAAVLAGVYALGRSYLKGKIE
jgi:hypothetical protein